MKFGISTACFFPNIYIEDTIDLIGKMDIDTAEVFFSCLMEYRPPFIAELKRRADENGIDIYSVHAFSLQFEPQLFTRHQRARQEALGIYRQVLEAAAALGAKVYVFHGPVSLKRTQKFAPDFDFIAPYTDELADIAAEYGIRLAWENVHYCWYQTPQFAKELLQRTHSGNLYFTLDVKQAAQAGFDPADFLADTRGRLTNIHLCDYVRAADGVSPRLPFKGDMDFSAFKAALDATGYNGGMMLEVYRHNYAGYEQLAENYAALRDLFLS